VVLQLNGTEHLGRVVLITPVAVHYLPPASADTVRIPVTSVFLVRFANGTREVLNRPLTEAEAATADSQDVLQRQRQARIEAGRRYEATGPMLGSFAAGLVGGPFGLVVPLAVGSKPVAPQNLGNLPAEHLTDPEYVAAYVQKANRKKKALTWLGYATGSVIWMAATGLINIDNSSWDH